jgi:hypothetical protein
MVLCLHDWFCAPVGADMFDVRGGAHSPFFIFACPKKRRQKKEGLAR